MKSKPNTQNKVMSAVKSLLEENAGLGFSLDLVAKRAGISKGGLLYHFPTKEALLTELVKTYCQDLDTRIEELIRTKSMNYSKAYVEACLTPEAIRASRILIAVAAIDERILEPMEQANIRWRQNLVLDLKDKAQALAISLIMDGYLLNASTETESISRKEILEAVSRVLRH